MKLPAVTLCLVFMGSAFAAAAAIEPTDKSCPVTIYHVDLRYNHAGGKSTPQLNVGFANSSPVKAEKITFSLTILNPDDNLNTYPETLSYERGLGAGKKREFLWDLNMNAVDIHHSGETVSVQEISFADGTNWRDDGSEACRLAVDFHAK